MEKKAVFLIEVSDKIILHKRPEKGLLSGLWELPNLDGELSAKELSEQMKKWEIGDYMIEPLGEGKHIFSHVEWQMRGYRIQMRDISEKLLEKEEWIAVSREDSHPDAGALGVRMLGANGKPAPDSRRVFQRLQTCILRPIQF